MRYPFVEHLGLIIAEQRAGFSRCTLVVAPQHRNSSGTVHGAVLFALADTGMGAALIPTLGAEESCATVNVNISYHRPVADGEIECITELVHRGRRIAHLESKICVAKVLVASASGQYAVLRRADPGAPAVESERRS